MCVGVCAWQAWWYRLMPILTWVIMLALICPGAKMVLMLTSFKLQLASKTGPLP